MFGPNIFQKSAARKIKGDISGISTLPFLVDSTAPENHPPAIYNILSASRLQQAYRNYMPPYLA